MAPNLKGVVICLKVLILNLRSDPTKLKVGRVHPTKQYAFSMPYHLDQQQKLCTATATATANSLSCL